MRSKVQLNIRVIGDTSEEKRIPLVLIEGDRQTLEFLGNYILAHARKPKDCGIQMFPNGPGGLGFSPNSELGLYLHLLPCWDDAEKLRLARKAKPSPTK